MKKPACTNCGEENQKDDNRTWWHLSRYYKVSGFFCPECYDLVSHDPYGKPRNPGGYITVLIKQIE